MQISLITLNARYSHSCPALFHVRNVLEQRLPHSRLVLRQFTINDPYYETLIRITGDQPESLCFSVYIWNAEYTMRLVRDLRRILPKAPIILGGPEATFMASEKLPAGCTIVRGEVEGLGDDFFRDLSTGTLRAEYRGAAAPPFGMPYRDADFSLHLENRNIYYESSRGCPFSCSYCLSSVEHGVRNRELAEVERELGVILAHGPKIIRFVDRTFNGLPERALAIWRWLLARPGETLFHFEIAPDLFSEEMLVFLAQVPHGRFQFEIGLQSTNPETLAAVNRRMDLDLAGKNIRRLAASGNIHLHLDLILGLPCETEATFKASLNAAFGMAPHQLQMGLLKVLPGTPISRAEEEFGLIRSATPPYSVLATRWLDHASLCRLYWLGECLEAFYNNRFFRNTLDYIRKKEEEPSGFFEQLRSVCQAADFFALAKTQEFMTRMLVELAQSRPDGELFCELLRFDWLVSGQRILPPYLGAESSKEIRDYLWRNLPEGVPPHYTRLTKNEFFKRGIFARFSGQLLNTVGLAEGGDSHEGYVCFLPEQESVGGYQRQQVAVFFLEKAQGQ
ncbi:MAG: B12-binding domain-containing radical SAM protein [Proteobacteria bacterium]|nr:B12-binding domain-containing radical SAM protein [Pseudomonadota bacterium]